MRIVIHELNVYLGTQAPKKMTAQDLEAAVSVLEAEEAARQQQRPLGDQLDSRDDLSAFSDDQDGLNFDKTDYAGHYGSRSRVIDGGGRLGNLDDLSDSDDWVTSMNLMGDAPQIPGLDDMTAPEAPTFDGEYPDNGRDYAGKNAVGSPPAGVEYVDHEDVDERRSEDEEDGDEADADEAEVDADVGNYGYLLPLGGDHFVAPALGDFAAEASGVDGPDLQSDEHFMRMPEPTVHGLLDHRWRQVAEAIVAAVESNASPEAVAASVVRYLTEPDRGVFGAWTPPAEEPRAALGRIVNALRSGPEAFDAFLMDMSQELRILAVYADKFRPRAERERGAVGHLFADYADALAAVSQTLPEGPVVQVAAPNVVRSAG